MMRWFSVNELWSERAKEFWALKMLLQHTVGCDVVDEDEQDPAAAMQRDPKKDAEHEQVCFSSWFVFVDRPCRECCQFAFLSEHRECLTLFMQHVGRIAVGPEYRAIR